MQYNLPSRLPRFIAVVGAVAIPVSGFMQWWRARRGISSPTRARLIHAAILARAPEPWHLSGDDSMGVGIDFLLLAGIALTSVIVVTIALVVERLQARRG